ncbi:cytoskeleton protein RodZ [Vibrio rumoiensis]|uniref:HTH cro/C1-type domain-containing protein n=1 Tax=Vibrio rumoiensis 1S-45 TaxID=1188252 RepID=A0A1E5E5B4_9VIBR|nr:cytoskeleton protein RodZ [Vibrio rumoiensis]OEF28614.1 hypothetical protein A1QC_04925 [Vibrio rumoiensis 1S-45]
MSTENNTEIELETPTEKNGLLPGEMLRKRREELGLSQQDISERLRLKVSVIESIESNHFDSHQVATFIRGYFRSYAKAVGISEKEILSALEQSGRGQHKEQPMHSFSQKNKLQKHDNHIMRITWGMLIVILGISSIWWWQNHQQDTLAPSAYSQSSADSSSDDQNDDFSRIGSDDSSSTESESTEQASDALSGDVTGSMDDFSAQSSALPTMPQSGEELHTDASDETASVNTNSTEKAEIKELASSETANKTLAMAFKDDCWIQVKDSSGAILSTGLKKAGQSLTLDGKTPYSIILGAPEGVSITLANEPVDLSRYTAGKVARLTLP